MQTTLNVDFLKAFFRLKTSFSWRFEGIHYYAQNEAYKFSLLGDEQGDCQVFTLN